MELAIFLGFAAVALVSAALMITRQNPVHSAMLLVVTFGALAALYILLRAPLLAVLQVAVYAGAIMVLFLFVIMLLAAERREITEPDPLRTMKWPTYLFCAAFLAVMCYVAWTAPARGTPGTMPPDVVAQHSQLIGHELFTTYLLPFEVASVMLLAAMVGAVVIAKRRFE
ncbi:MAG: NADH-quinone oxidoreductase subunit J family protein [Armatimonadota bacterium]